MAQEFIGYSGTGSLVQTGGSHSAVQEFIGDSGSGSVLQSGGTNTTNYLYLGYDKISDRGAYSLSGSGILSVISNETIGFHAIGSFTQSGEHIPSAPLSFSAPPWRVR